MALYSPAFKYKTCTREMERRRIVRWKGKKKKNKWQAACANQKKKKRKKNARATFPLLKCGSNCFAV